MTQEYNTPERMDDRMYPPPVWGSRSATIAKLAAALSKAQAVLEAAKKDANNPFFKSKYADLSSVWAAVRGPLTANELSILQEPSTSDGRVTVTTTLMHSSGEYVRSSLSMPVKDQTAQGYGSAVTYARRYALQSVMGIAPEDDDGNAASQPVKTGARLEQKSLIQPQQSEGAIVEPFYYDISQVVAPKLAKAQELLRLNKARSLNDWDTVWESPVLIDKLIDRKITKAEAYGS
jgi:hypothetical protein